VRRWQPVQALSKRIHYGKFIAEAKFLADPDTYTPLIRDQDVTGLMNLLTFPKQEQRVVARVQAKAALFGQDIGEDGRATDTSYKVQPALVASLYRNWVMPLTKEVQVPPAAPVDIQFHPLEPVPVQFRRHSKSFA